MSLASDLIDNLVTPLDVSPAIKSELSAWYTLLANIIDANDSGGSFSGTMDDIPNGAVYVKTENNFTDAYLAIVSGVTAALAAKQATLVSGTNIKNLNGNTLLGSGDLVISGGLSQQQVEGLI